MREREREKKRKKEKIKKKEIGSVRKELAEREPKEVKSKKPNKDNLPSSRSRFFLLSFSPSLCGLKNL